MKQRIQTLETIKRHENEQKKSAYAYEEERKRNSRGDMATKPDPRLGMSI